MVNLPKAPDPKPVLAKVYTPRQIYLQPKDFEKYGYTGNCRRCTYMHQGRKVQGMNHTGPCRIRIEGYLKNDQYPRIAAHAARLNEEVARRLEVREGALVTGASATSPIEGATATIGDTITGTIDDNIRN